LLLLEGSWSTSVAKVHPLLRRYSPSLHSASIIVRDCQEKVGERLHGLEKQNLYRRWPFQPAKQMKSAKMKQRRGLLTNEMIGLSNFTIPRGWAL
jgi:hypothetical protein